MLAGAITSTEPPTRGGAVVLVGEDAWAPGLLAARLSPSAATSCLEPQPDAWFAGVGARPGHRSVVELVNPDPARPSSTSRCSRRPGRSTSKGSGGCASPGAARSTSTCPSRCPGVPSWACTSRSRGAGSRPASGTPPTGWAPGLAAGDWLAPQAEPADERDPAGSAAWRRHPTPGPRQRRRRRDAGEPAGGQPREHVRARGARGDQGPAPVDPVDLHRRGARAAGPRRSARASWWSRPARSPPPCRRSSGSDLAPISAGPVIESQGAVLAPPGPKELLARRRRATRRGRRRLARRGRDRAERGTRGDRPGSRRTRGAARPGDVRLPHARAHPGRRERLRQRQRCGRCWGRCWGRR